MQDDFYGFNKNHNEQFEFFSGGYSYKVNRDGQMFIEKTNLRFLEVVCLGEPDDDLTVSEVICARFSDEEIQMLGLSE